MTSPGINVDTSVNDAARTPLALSLEAMVSRLDALINVQQDTRQDLKANLDMISQFSTNSGAQGAARQAQDSLLDGGNPLAGYTMGSPQTFNPASQGFAAMPQGYGNAGMYGGYPMWGQQGAAGSGAPDPVEAMAQYQVPVSQVRAAQAAYMGQQIAGQPIDLNPYDQSPSAPGYGQAVPPPASGGSNTPQAAPPAPPAPPAGGGGGGGGGGGPAGPAGSPVPSPAGGGPGGGGGPAGGGGVPTQAQAQAGVAVAGSQGDFSSLMQQFGSIPGIATKLPYVGGALAVAKYGSMGVQEFMNQRNQGYRWQQIEGGTNWQAQRERFHSAVYRYTTPGFEPGEAQAAFERVSSIGLNRRAEGSTTLGRQEALDFIYRNKTNMGMGVDESAALVEQSANVGGSLAGLTEALRDLSDAAGAAGLNTMMVRANFTEARGAFLQAGQGDVGATQNAWGSMQYATMGAAMANIDDRGQTSRNMNYRYAAQAGMSIGEWMVYQRTNPTGAASVRDANTQRQLDVNVSDAQKDWIRARVKAVRDQNGEVTNEDFEQIGRQFEAQFKPDNVYPIIDMLKSQAGFSGVNETNWSQFLVRHIAGDTKSARMEEEYGQTGQIRDGKYVTGPKAGQDAPSAARNRPGGIEDDGAVDRWLERDSDGNIDVGGSLKDIIPNTASVIHNATDIGAIASDIFSGRNPLSGYKDRLFGQDSKAADAYKAWQRRNPGLEEPVIENLLSKVEDPNSQMVEVDVDASGEPRVMTLAEAIRDYHNEVVAGKVRLLDKSGKTKTMDEIGVATDTTRDTTLNDDEEHKTGKTKEEYGEELDNGAGWNPFDGRKGWGAKAKGLVGKLTNDGRGDKTSTASKVTLDLTPEARRLVQQMGGSDSAASGEPEPAESRTENR